MKAGMKKIIFHDLFNAWISSARVSIKWLSPLLTLFSSTQVLFIHTLAKFFPFDFFWPVDRESGRFFVALRYEKKPVAKDFLQKEGGNAKYATMPKVAYFFAIRLSLRVFFSFFFYGMWYISQISLVLIHSVI